MPAAVLVVSLVAIATVFGLSARVFSRTPTELGQQPDGDPLARPTRVDAQAEPSLPGRALWADWRFRTLAAGMALGLFAQIGLLSHLFSLAVPALGPSRAGLVMGLATLAAILGRTSFGWMMPPGADRRLSAMLSYGIQIVGGGALMMAAGQSANLIVAGILLFGFGIGNATSLPPLIAQAEFSRADSLRAVALIVALSQTAYSVAPAAFGIVRRLSGRLSLPELTAVAAVATAVQILAICAFASGRPGGAAVRGRVGAPSA